jgi:hypothetical protein
MCPFISVESKDKENLSKKKKKKKESKDKDPLTTRAYTVLFFSI